MESMFLKRYFKRILFQDLLFAPNPSEGVETNALNFSVMFLFPKYLETYLSNGFGDYVKFHTFD